MPKRVLQKLASTQQHPFAGGTLIVKKSLKPFPNGQRVTAVLAVDFCPFTNEPAYVVEGRDGLPTTILMTLCVAKSSIDETFV